MSRSPTEINPDDHFWKCTWIDCVNDYFFNRELVVINKHNNSQPITRNQTIMEYAAEYIKPLKIIRILKGIVCLWQLFLMIHA